MCVLNLGNDSIRNSQITRRALALGSLAAAALVAACSPLSDEEDGPSNPTDTPEPTATQEVTPTPTQIAIGSPVPGFSDPVRWEGRVITVASWGGEYQDAQRQAFFAPFAEATGATVQEKVADLSDLRSQVDDGNVLWDVLTVPMEDQVRLAQDDYLAPLAYDVIDTTSLYPDIVLEYGVGAAYFSTILTFPTGSQSAPASWADFWSALSPEAEGFECDSLSQSAAEPGRHIRVRAPRRRCAYR